MFVPIRRLLLLAALAIPTIAAASLDDNLPTRTFTTDSLPQTNVNPHGIVTRSLRVNDADFMTNAQRLSRGLPPNRPRARGARALMPRASSTCVQQTGVIGVVAQGAPQSVGFVSRVLNIFGEYAFTPNRAEALTVSVCRPTAPGTFAEILALNGPTDFPFVGAVVGFASTSNDLRPGSFNYVYVAGTSDAPRGRPMAGPNTFSATTGIARSFETTIWQVNAAGRVLPSWVNTDGSTPAVELLLYRGGGDNVFIITGDAAAARAAFGTQVYDTTFTFVAN